MLGQIPLYYLACSFIKALDDNQLALREILGSAGDSIEDWTDADKVIPYTYDIFLAIKKLVEKTYLHHTPIIIEPVWKTDGKSPRLSFHCLDVFVWSNCGLLMLFIPQEEDFSVSPACNKFLKKITRHSRSMIWLFKMLKDYANYGQFNGAQVIDAMSYNLKNDKAFSSNGMRTYPIMHCSELLRPRIIKDEIKNIILGGGQELLSPERRFDAIIYNSPDLF